MVLKVSFSIYSVFKEVRKIKKYKPPNHPNFSQNLDENFNLKIYLVWPNLSWMLTIEFIETSST